MISLIPLFGFAAVACSRQPAAPGCAEYIAKANAMDPTLIYVGFGAVAAAVIASLFVGALTRFR